MYPVWCQGYTGRDVVVSILDDGIEKDHPDIRKNYVRICFCFLRTLVLVTGLLLFKCLTLFDLLCRLNYGNFILHKACLLKLWVVACSEHILYFVLLSSSAINLHCLHTALQ